MDYKNLLCVDGEREKGSVDNRAREKEKGSWCVCVSSVYDCFLTLYSSPQTIRYKLMTIYYCNTFIC